MNTTERGERSVAFLRLYAEKVRAGTDLQWEIPNTRAVTLEDIADYLTALQREQVEASKRASKLEDAAFHFQTCYACRKLGEDSCLDGARFAAFLRGEDDGD